MRVFGPLAATAPLLGVLGRSEPDPRVQEDLRKSYADREAEVAGRRARLALAEAGSIAKPEPTHYLRGGIGDKRAARKARAEAERAAKREAKRRRQLGLPECETCEDAGFVPVHSEHPPAFDTCPRCFNPKGHPLP